MEDGFYSKYYKNDETYAPPSLSTYRGDIRSGGFSNLIRYIYNWGFQYFLAEFLNFKTNQNLVNDILYYVQDNYQTPIFDQIDSTHFSITGDDSLLFHDSIFQRTQVFPYLLDTDATDFFKAKRNSDLALCLKSGDDEIIIFGEVEGNHGNSLLKQYFWDSKPLYSLFGIGVIPNRKSSQGLIWLENDVLLKKTIVTIEADNNVFGDFKRIINFLEDFMLRGNSWDFRSSYRYEPYILRLSEIMNDYWNSPIDNLIYFLESIVYPEDTVGEIKNSSLILVPDMQLR
ncbi:hypothetical protein OZX61_11880 (plasmid) [Acinetobacter sp. ESL0695]|uniref:hypothetical protein n=1 Tax=Acinetobacter sp. ESL0695 TaxID=2983215 RepID=UPI0023EFD9B1|nr:hypothetical protein [Acinetobacter sp. ESL0695]WEV50081.1 hypothetical protein OZX61_11880 [Acinetobacter sp. ESL0695]